jgi:hypothetical protein
MNLSLVIPLAVAIVSAIVIIRRQLVCQLGAYGRALAIPFLLVAWFVGLSVGQHLGSLAAMAWTAAAPLVAIAGIAVARFKRCRLNPMRWSVLDRIVFLALVALIIAYNGNDNSCHYAIVNTYVRGNIPPCSLNDPSAPLLYHALFDGAAALWADGFGLVPETALDVVTAVCVFACIAALQAVSRMLFCGRWTQQAARLFFLAGFGPVYLTAIWGAPVPDIVDFFRGQTTQPFAESFFRRPMGLNYVLFLFLLAAVLPRFSSRWGRAHSVRTVHAAMLLPAAYLVPQASEELVALAAVLAMWLWISGKLALRWLAAWSGLAAVSLFMSPVIQGMLFAGSGAPVPELAMGWPPTLPRWDATEEAIIKDGLPLFSTAALLPFALEWGPLFVWGLILGAADPRRRVIAAVYVVGVAVACSFRLNEWIKADLDRFLFYGTSGGFMLVATWIEKLETIRRRSPRPGWFFRVLSVVLIVVPTTAGPAGYAVGHIVRAFDAGFQKPRVDFPDDLRKLLAPVGAREQVLTDTKYAQGLVLSGFIVAAPLAANPTGMVLPAEFPAYLARPNLKPHWLLLPADDPRVAGQMKIAEFEGYVLVRRARGR